jgi:glycosyltransferase involved in cell wall biosynthesis
MQIAAHFTQHKDTENPLLTSLKILSEIHPEVKFIFFVDTLIEGLNKNCTQIIVSPKPKNNFLLLFWYKFKLYGFLKQRAKMVFIGDVGLISEQAKCPQYLFFCKENFLQDTNLVFKNKFVDSVVKANKIFVSETFLAKGLQNEYNLSHQKMETIFHGLSGKAKTYSNTTIEEIKTIYSKGFDYYLYAVTNTSKDYILQIVKAFSQLKKMQKTTMKLVLLLDDVHEENLIVNFKNYKYRDEVIFIIQDVNNRRNIVAASNALFYFSEYKTNNIAFVALQQEIPIVTMDNEINRSVFDQAVLYTENTDKAITEKMQLLYKDETIKSTFSMASKEFIKKYDAKKVAEQLYNAIHIN